MRRWTNSGKAILCNVWNNILQRVHQTSTAFQAIELDLCNAVKLVSSFRDDVAGIRDDFDKFESDAKTCFQLCPKCTR